MLLVLFLSGLHVSNDLSSWLYYKLPLYQFYCQVCMRLVPEKGLIQPPCGCNHKRFYYARYGICQSILNYNRPIMAVLLGFSVRKNWTAARRLVICPIIGHALFKYNVNLWRNKGGILHTQKFLHNTKLIRSNKSWTYRIDCWY